MEAQPKYRYRLTFSKEYRVKYIAHLDLVLAWTRAFRRAGIPLAYSGGFNPQAKIQVAAGLPVGYMGRAELMDIYLTGPMDPAEVFGRVNGALPLGFQLLAVEAVDPQSPNLQAALSHAEYSVTVETNLSGPELAARIEALLNAAEIIQMRVRRQQEEMFNLRPLLCNLKLETLSQAEATLSMRLAAGQNGNLRPDDVLEALGLGDAWRQVERTKLCFTFDS